MDINNFFTQFNSQDSYAILFIMLVAFLFGLLLGYILRSRRVNELRRELKEKKKELADAEAQVEALQEQLGLKEADLKKAGFALREAEARVERVEEEKETLHKEIFNLNRKLEEIQAADRSYETTIEELNTTIIGLKEKNKQLSQTLEVEDEGTENLAQMQSIYNATRNRLEEMEARLGRLEGVNSELRSELDSLKEQGVQSRPKAITAVPEPAAVIHPQPSLPDADVVKKEPALDVNPDKNVLGDKILPEEEVPEKDDLTRIEGIGAFLEKKLNEIGVYTFEEIASWDSERIREVTEAIEYFEGRIERDNWVEQAARLALRKQENPESFQKKPGPLSKDPENLQAIEGIGPQIEELLKNAGIRNWEGLADANIEQLKAILESADESFQGIDPSSWPDQARLAKNGEWAVLQEYQNELSGGE